MIRHIVMFQLKEHALGKPALENALEAKRKFYGLAGRIPSLRRFEVGINSEEAPGDNFHIVLVCEFEDAAGLNAYQDHPAHMEFGAFMSRIREKRACIDYEFQGAQ